MPEGIYLNPRDRLHYSVYSSVVTTLYMTLYMLNEKTKEIIEVPLEPVITGSVRAEESANIRLAQTGLLVGFDAFTNTAMRGQCYLLASIRFGAEGSRGLGLVTGYVSKGRDLNWLPSGGILEDMKEGLGVDRSITGTNPAAGAEILETVPTNAVWKLKTITVSMVTDATVTNRQLSIIIDDGTNIIWAQRTNTNVGASLTKIHILSDQHSRIGTDGTYIHMALPSNLVLLEGYRIRSVTTNWQVGDDYGAPQLDLEEWIEDQ